MTRWQSIAVVAVLGAPVSALAQVPFTNDLHPSPGAQGWSNPVGSFDLIATGTNFISHVWLPSSDGNSYAGGVQYSGVPGTQETLQRTVTGLTSGAQYTVRWEQMADRVQGASTEEAWFDVVFCGVRVEGPHVPFSQARIWRDTALTFTANASSCTLQFVARNPSGNNSNWIFLDNIRMVAGASGGPTCINPPPITGGPAEAAAPAGWTIFNSTPDLISGNGPWPGGGYTVSNVGGTSTSGGTMGLFLTNGGRGEEWATTLTGLTAGTSYRVAVEWQQQTLTGGVTYEGGGMFMTVDGATTVFPPVGTAATDTWMPASVTFTATGPTATLVIGIDPATTFQGGIVIDSGAACSAPTCGNGSVDVGEQCDDRNMTAGDGCSATCQVEAGYVCTGVTSTCSIRCGDGVRAASEACDDGNTMAGDGCSATCTVEAGYACTNPDVRVFYTHRGRTDCIEVPGFEPAANPTVPASYTLPGVVAGRYRARHVAGAIDYSDRPTAWRAPTLLQWDPGTGPTARVFGGLTATGQTSVAGAVMVAQATSFDFPVGVAGSVRGATPDVPGACGNNSDDTVMYRVDSLSVCTAVPVPTITTPAEASVTASTTPAITGTCTAGSTVTIRQGAATVCTATCAAAGTYSCTPTTPLTPGPQMITATQTVSGVTSAATPVRNFTVLGAPSITTPTEGAVTSSTPAISGACVAGAAVTVREGTTTVCTATCSATGTYTCTPSAPLSTGPHMIVATQVLSGATSPSSPVRSFSVAACMDTSTTGMDMGCSAATPYCVGSGAAAMCVACTMASHCNDSNACTADSCSAAGACVFTAIAAGSPGMCAAGLVCSGAPSNMCIAPIPTIVTPAEGSSTTDTTPDITGACVAGATVTIREGTATVCTATCSSTGTYTCTPSAPMTLGGHMLTATQVVGGSMSGASPVRNFSIVTCLDSATGAGTDSGCSMTSPICVGAGTSMARCQPCQDSTTGGTDLGCMAAAPACVAGADGTNLCLPCEDSATGNMLDNGCMTAAPICLTGEGGARECVECTADTHCGVGRVCNSSNECVPGCTTDADCVGTPATPVCNVPERECAECNVTADCDGTETCEMHECVQPDSDDDGTPDDEDLDDDNDGIPDTRELPTGLAGDADNDGILDFEDPSAQADGFDCMASADGVCTRFPATVDFDGDGIANHLDLDADGDGILDVIEAGGMAAADGTIAGFADLNGNGLADSVDAMPLPIPNTDGTDGPDFLDLDSDRDGLFDAVEGGYTGTIGTDGRPMGEDANDDGVIDTLIGTGQLPTPDFDGDGRRDFQDPDDDNDSIPTEFEAPDANGNGRPDDARDTDGDGRPDYLDVDDDGDGIDTEFEAPDANDDGNPSDARDTDDDSTPDYLDPDDDGDSLDTEDEMSDPNGDGNPDDAVDTDRDGTPDYLDPREIPTDAPRDAGARDAGAGTPDAGPRNGGLSGGACGCTVNTSGSNTGFLAMLGVLGLVVARRRRRNGSETTA